VAGFLGAMASTATRSQGGNTPRAPRARGLLQAIAAVRQIALTPPAHRLAFTGQLGGHPQRRGAVWRSGPEEQPTAKSQGVRGGMGTHQRLQTRVFLRSQSDRAGNRHGPGQSPSGAAGPAQPAAHMPIILPIVVPKTSWHRIYKMDI
jgi:hypothetical protein